MNWITLVEVPDLAAHLNAPNVRLLDARFVLTDAIAGRTAYTQSHLPGALFADLNQDLSDLSKTANGEGRHPLPDEHAFTTRLGEWGITPTHQVVVYDAGDGSMAAARLWWLLRVLGHTRVAVLNGGLAAWRAAGLPETQQQQMPIVQPPYPAHFDGSQMVSDEDVLARISEAGWLVDARTAMRYSGREEPVDPVAGHVPSAVNLPYQNNVSDGKFYPSDLLRAKLQAFIGARALHDIVLMCGSGVTACHLLLAFEHAGLSGVRIYPGSWSGWISDPTRPIAVS